MQGYAGSTVVIEATKTIRAGDAQTLAQGQKETQLGFEQRADSLIVYLSGPQDSRPRRNWNRNWDSRDIDYSYEFDFVVKVPAAMQVLVSTVNGGEVLVQDVSGPLRARNVNGDVTLRGVGQLTQAYTVNGQVAVSYAAAPTRAATYHTINGNINVSYPASVSGDVYFKSMHGELYTDFPQAALLPARVQQNQAREGAGTKYKISKETALRLGQGGLDLRFETLNGNVTIKKQ